MANNPLHQFEVKPWITLPEVAGFDLSITNSTFAMLVAVAVAYGMLGVTFWRAALVPGRWQAFGEMIYDFIADTVRDTIGHDGKKFFPFIFTLFLFILFCNLLGMVPYNFTATSHIVVTFALAILVFLTVTLVGMIKQGPIKFMAHFMPPGLSDNLVIFILIGPLMYVIELISFLSRPISLSIRLAANMTAGHIMMKVIAGMAIAAGVLVGVAPFILLVLMTGFEIFVAVLQAYIFTILSCVYLGEAMHHGSEH